MKKRVLCLLVDGFEEIEAISPVDLLRRAGADVVLASVGKSLELTGRSGIQIKAEVMLDEVLDEPFDLLFLPGGPGVKKLREDGRAAKLAKTFYAEGNPVAAICAAPTVLKDAGILPGRRHTAHFSVTEELPDALLEEIVVIDEHVITSRGAGTAIEFGLVLVNQLFGEQARRDVAVSIMH